MAVFNRENDGINIFFPDIPGCFSCAETIEEAIINAKEVMGLHLYSLLKDGDEIPEPSALKALELGRNDIPYLVDIYMPEFKAAIKEVYVKKTLTFPSSLANKVKKDGMNFPKILREAIEVYLEKDAK
ncbi:MAG TPA: type II toxin-antitoxin system HicB family antitoxin [Thermotogota bacterium]|nr:type II toxin-antitoxin system HicB family antitoxin [Thermotogota bacterium]HPR96343.1 type II toxin-antitoxin system HicB family antitoxin [Thermotogota bacterium]